ncbi:MAG: nucleotidyl transferase AbiEii/AbiGii toxin family protein [Bifidobacteriaceae bacterium]|nr:nucleotidyl transferase AbiEii/AbiGii toxin family protein [Bifidobacteriaceae bacterium]
MFLVKGGVYIEFHFGLKARATRDVDTLFRGGLADFERRLDEALAEPRGPFQLARSRIETIDAPKLVQPRRFSVRLTAKGAAYGRCRPAGQASPVARGADLGCAAEHAAQAATERAPHQRNQHEPAAPRNDPRQDGPGLGLRGPP